MRSKDKDLRQLANLRRQIDKLDRKLMRVLNERLKIVDRIGEIKARQGMPVFQRRRIAEILRDRKEYGTGIGLRGAFVRAVCELIHEEAVVSQTKAIEAAVRRQNKRGSKKERA